MSNYASRIGWYDREGQLLDDYDDIEQKLKCRTYKVVRQTKLRGGKKLVSTVWLGCNHNYSDGPPLIFETMVFPVGSYYDLDCRRYATEAEARAGHALLCRQWAVQQTAAEKVNHECG